VLARQTPLPPTPASRRLRRLLAITAVAVIVVEAINLQTVAEPSLRELASGSGQWVSLVVRSIWALLRVIGFLFLMRAVRYGRAAARPFGLILAITTVFAVARLTEPREGSLVPDTAVIVGFIVLAVLCGLVVWLLYKSPAVADHLATRPVRRHIPGWVLTARVALLTYSALVLVPLLIAFGTLFGDRRQPLLATVDLLIGWLVLCGLLVVLTPSVSLFVLMGKGWARWAMGTLSVLVLLAQPLLCYALLGLDGLVRDGIPLIVTALLGLYALYRSRGQPTWVRPVPVG
jgi:hypothetical protein